MKFYKMKKSPVELNFIEFVVLFHILGKVKCSEYLRSIYQFLVPLFEVLVIIAEVRRVIFSEMTDSNSYSFNNFKKMPSIGCVYAIRCLGNGKIYVGSTEKFRSRMTRHSSYLRRNAHHSEKFQRAYNKYGISSFEISILEYAEKKLCEIEVKWIEKLDSFNDGLNMTEKSFKMRNFKMTAEQISRAVKKSSKSVIVLNLTGEIVKLFPSVSEAAHFAKTSSSNISRTCKGEFRVMNGYQFVYASEYDESKDYKYVKPKRIFTQAHKGKLSKALSGRKQSVEHRNALRKVQGTWVDKFSIEGKFITRYYSLTTCCKSNNIRDLKFLRRRIKDQKPFNNALFYYVNDRA